MGKFEKGHPGGPGRPRGSRNRMNIVLDQVAEGEAQRLLSDLVTAAHGGDHIASRMVLGRIWSAPRGRVVTLELPEIRTPDDLLAAHAVVAKAIASAEITPQEGASVSSVLETHRRAFELVAQERQVEALEREVKALKANVT